MGFLKYKNNEPCFSANISDYFNFIHGSISKGANVVVFYFFVIKRWIVRKVQLEPDVKKSWLQLKSSGSNTLITRIIYFLCASFLRKIQLQLRWWKSICLLSWRRWELFPACGHIKSAEASVPAKRTSVPTGWYC